MLKRMEAVGSKSGKTARRVTIRDCGQVASRLQRALALAAEREELASFKRDPVAVDPDAEAAARLRALRGEPAGDAEPDVLAGDDADAAGGVGEKRKRGAGGAADARVDAGPSGMDSVAAPVQGRAGEGGGAVGGAGGEDATDARVDGTAGGDGSAERGGDGGAGVKWEDEALAGLNPRQRRLLELKRKGQRARKANENAAVSEAKRDRKGAPDPNLERKKWLDQQLKQKQVRPRRPVALSVG